MEQKFQIHLPLINRNFQVRKSSFDLIILREALFSVTIDNLPLIEYFVFFDHSLKNEQIKAKVYKTVADRKWYDKNYSEEAALNSPEFCIPEINSEIKKAIDVYESMHAGIQTYF